jgi:transcription elongation factor Elf1
MPYKDPEKLKEYKRQHYIKNKDKYREASIRSKKNTKPKKREFVSRYKLKCGCRLCGYNDSATALEFHHIDPSEKDSAISRLISGNWGLKTIKKEIRKCVVLCANCHRTVHKEIERGVKHDWFLDTNNNSDNA